MTNKNYVRGRAFEYEIMGKLRKAGWTCERAAASHGPIDIFAGKETLQGTPQLRLIQAKNYKPKPGETRFIFAELRGAQSVFGGMGILVYKEDGKIRTKWCASESITRTTTHEFYWEGLTTP
jgi:hypothetical protein